jgi:hypothetical protein
MNAKKFLLDTVNAAISSNLTNEQCRLIALRLLDDDAALLTIQIRGGLASACVNSKPDGGPVGGSGDAPDLATPFHWIETKS